MALDFDGPVRDAAQAVCPLHSAGDRVEWAGLPINLDMAFSQRQRDKVYMQHLMRMRGAQLRRALPDEGQQCVCESAADRGRLDLDAAQDYISS